MQLRQELQTYANLNSFEMKFQSNNPIKNTSMYTFTLLQLHLLKPATTKYRIQP